MKKPKNTICLWFDKDALDAARFYAATFPESEVQQVTKRLLTFQAVRKAMC
jgi:predicted 3-demethylubiquinone-9 3-methyltransferase (glyoxalase superfamily)